MKPGEGQGVNKGYVNGGLVDDDEKQKTLQVSKPAAVPVGGRPGSLVFDSATACWLPTNNEDTLTNISLSVKSGELVAVIGPVGSGKVSTYVRLLRIPLKFNRKYS